MNRVNERLWVIEIPFSKTPKTIHDRHVKLSLVRHCTDVGLEKAYSLVTRGIPVILLIPLKLDFSVTYRNGGRGHKQELVDQQVVPSSGRS
jgi:hypothetical protein